MPISSEISLIFVENPSSNFPHKINNPIIESFDQTKIKKINTYKLALEVDVL